MATDWDDRDMEHRLLSYFNTSETCVIGMPQDPEDAVYMVVAHAGGTEIEFFEQRPHTPGIGGEESNWPQNYQVWRLVEENGEVVE